MPHIPQGTTDTVAPAMFWSKADAALRPSLDYDEPLALCAQHSFRIPLYSGHPGPKASICV